MKKPYQDIKFELIKVGFSDSVMSKAVSDLDDNELPFTPEYYNGTPEVYEQQHY